MKRCTVFSAGPNDCKWIDEIRNKGYMIAADGGYLLAGRHGLTPDLVVGDFDSAQKPDFLKTVSFASEKDDTDTGLAVRYGLSNGCREFLLFGCTGGLLDHTIANISLLSSLCMFDASGWILDDMSAITVRHEGTLRFACEKGVRFSVFPWGGDCMVSYESVKYPLHHHILESDFPLGVSNEATENLVEIQIEKGAALIIVSNFSNTFVDSVYNEV